MEYVDIEPETKENFINEKQYISISLQLIMFFLWYNSKLDNIDCLFIISSSNDSIKFEIKPLQKLTYYEKIFSFDNLIQINKIFAGFDSIEAIRNSFEHIIEQNNYILKKFEENIEIIFKVPYFEKTIDITLILDKKLIKQKKLNESLLEEIKLLKEDLKILKEENKELKVSNEEFKKEIEKLKSSNGLLFELYSKVIKNFNDIYYENKDKFNFKFLLMTNYSISYNGLIATKLFKDDWSTSTIGDNKIPEYRLSHWRIRINKISEDNKNTWKILIGIGPNYDFSELFHRKCWSFICGKCELCLRDEKSIPYNNIKRRKLKSGDIVEVIVDRTKGELSFKVNNEDFGIASKDIPNEGDLYPFISMYNQGQIVEILWI